ncbi:MAG: cytochrome c3 family protein [Pseudomonadota bacterium]
MKIITHGLMGLFLTALIGCNCVGPEVNRTIGEGTVILELPKRFGPLDRPVVEFDHTSHEKALKKEGCKACHPQGEKGEIVYRVWANEENIDRKTLINLFHEKCVGCHKKRSVLGKSKGPLSCGKCHVNQVAAVSTRKAMAFDYFLHDRHVNSPGSECETCHHKTNNSCRDCHKSTAQAGVGSFRDVSHKSCIKCHITKSKNGEKSGPTLCTGCHGQKSWIAQRKQSAFPRLSGGQPDQVWLLGPESKMGAVGFDHQAHEPLTSFCSNCHHRTLRACKSCHTLSGNKDGEETTLAKAYHSAGSTRSCVGCHEKAAHERDCSGCHGALGESPSKRSCTLCHAGPTSSAIASTMPTSFPKKGEINSLPGASENFPDTVVIGTLVKKYNQSILPHRKIAGRLDEIVRKSKLATRFHVSTDTLCTGCHHHSPIGTRPPPCKACHGKTEHSTLDKPGLKVAYHRQCVGCHQKMGIKAQGCTDCHSKKVGDK